MKTISSAQIDRLYQFTRQHYVVYYDVQTELVDHLASAIEARWEENPEKNFEDLLQQEFKKFGVFGFMDVVEERQKTMQKYYLKLVWQEAKQFLKLPKVILVGFIFWATAFAFTITEYGVLIICSICIAITICMFVRVCFKINAFRKLLEKGEKKLYLLEEFLLNLGGGFLLFQIPGNIFFSSGYISHPETFPFYAHVFSAFLLTIFSLFSYIVFYVLPSKKENILKKAYPELNSKNV